MSQSGLQVSRRADFFSLLDYWLLVPILLMSVIGLYVLQGITSSDYANGTAVFMRQSGAVLAGIVIALLVALVEYPLLRFVSWSVYGLGVVLLVVVLVDNYSLAAKWGSDSWLLLPVIGSFQPAELAKVGIALAGAWLLEDMGSGRISRPVGFLALAVLAGVPLFLILRQPDLGTALVIVAMLAVMLFLWGIRLRWVLIAGSLAGLSAIPIFQFVLKPHQKLRILTFLYPSLDPDNALQIDASLRAIAAGGLLGSTSDVRVQVPVKESDFIFAGLAERMGFVGALLLILLVFFFLCRGMRVAARAPGTAGSMMASGIVAVIAIHYIENIGMNVGLLPITGIPLPFISLGGTAMLVNFLMLGILLAISMEERILVRDRET